MLAFIHIYSVLKCMQTQMHPPSRNSINIQGELILASVSALHEHQRHKENQRGGENGRKKQERERKKATMRDGKEEIEESKQWEL